MKINDVSYLIFLSIIISQVCLEIDTVMPENSPDIFNWNLIFSDEFNNKTIDHDDWDIFENGIKVCQANSIQEYNCKKNTTRIILFEGNMVILPINGNDSKSNNFVLKSKRYFKYGRFEIRAALPGGNNLITSVHLEPTGYYNEEKIPWSKDGNINIISNKVAKSLYYGIKFAKINKEKIPNNELNKNFSEVEFHTYVMDWTETELRWSIDHKLLYRASLLKEVANYFNPFVKPFKLALLLDLVSNHVPLFKETDQNQCTLLIIDYIRVYELKANKKNSPSYFNSNFTRNMICEKLMPAHIVNLKEESPLSILAIISIASLIIILAIIVINCILYNRFKNRQSVQSSNVSDAGKEGIDNEFEDVLDDNSLNDERYENIETNYDQNQYSTIDYDRIDQDEINPRYLPILNNSNYDRIRQESPYLSIYNDL